VAAAVSVPPAGRFDRSYFETRYTDYERQNPPHKLAFYRRLAEEAAAGIARPRVLDVGCAFGAFLSALDPAWDLHGLDVSEYAVERARAALPRARLAVAGAAAIPFDPPFDVVTAFDVLEHIHELDAVREAIRDSLAPQGRLVFVVPVYSGITGPIVRWLDRDDTHVHRRSRTFWLEWAGAAFEVVEWRGLFRYLLPGGHYAHRPTRRFRRAAPAIAVSARKRGIRRPAPDGLKKTSARAHPRPL
jgi:SAM-dependent methyltransferase